MTAAQQEEIITKDFFDMILPGVVKFYSDHYICGDSYRCVWAVREYPPSTEEQAVFSQLADRTNVTLRMYNRLVDSMEQRKIIQNATRRNKLMSGGNDVQETLDAENNLKDVVQLLADLRKNREPLLHCSVFLELKAQSPEKLKELQSDVLMELTRSKVNIDRLTLRQKEGFLSVLPFGSNQFGSQFERVLPASSVANLYPFNYSGNVGGEPFWRWYGFESRVEWCAIFVSWCADQSGLLSAGILPRFSVCDEGVRWFQARNRWKDNSYTPSPGDIIFFDWAFNGLDGNTDHVGIVERVENDRVYTIEGNSGDTCRECSYPLGYYEIQGYGLLETESEERI